MSKTGRVNLPPPAVLQIHEAPMALRSDQIQNLLMEKGGGWFMLDVEPSQWFSCKSHGLMATKSL